MSGHAVRSVTFDLVVYVCIRVSGGRVSGVVSDHIRHEVVDFPVNCATRDAVVDVIRGGGK